MKKIKSILSDFQILRPKYETSQEDTLEWLAQSHSYADRRHSLEECRAKIKHVGCKPEVIASRGHEIEDICHFDWERMSVYRLHESTKGVPMACRQEIHQQCVDSIFQRFYPSSENPPTHIVHVTCTGYSMPNGAQKIVSKHQWGSQTAVTNVYHMGCYASIPAIRMAAAWDETKTDIVHTELCTLHHDPSSMAPDQLVAQSLFADGFIKYSMGQVVPHKPHLTFNGSHEELIPNSLDLMAWNLTEWGFKFVLAKEIPAYIARHLQTYLMNFCNKFNRDLKQLMDKAIFAIHPGGPKILQYAQELLKLRDDQLKHSREVLRDYGNMSSGTLPHIWSRMCADEKIAGGTPIISFAFGPGLTIAGALLEKGVWE